MVRRRTHPDLPEFTTVIWECGKCGWRSEDDDPPLDDSGASNPAPGG